MPETDRLYEPAAAHALLCIGGGKKLYIGSLEQADWHLHGATVFIAAGTGSFMMARAGAMTGPRTMLRA